MATMAMGSGGWGAAVLSLMQANNPQTECTQGFSTMRTLNSAKRRKRARKGPRVEKDVSAPCG